MNENKIDKEILSWLFEGDVSIQYQTYRDILKIEKPSVQKRIQLEGWGAKFLSFQHDDGHWGRAFYQPKWISTHYTLLDLKNLGISPQVSTIHKSLKEIFINEIVPDGGINPSPTIKESDVCLNGMVLNYASYFQVKENMLHSIIDFILSQQMPDGGFNCCLNRSGAVHSSLHSTISVLEGIHEYKQNKYSYRNKELQGAEKTSREFILMHKLFRSDRTGNIISPKFLKFSYPCRWYYDILRAMEYFYRSDTAYNVRMEEAISVILKKRKKSGVWSLEARHPGKTHFEMEKVGQASRWNTLRCLRVLEKYYQPYIKNKK